VLRRWEIDFVKSCNCSTFYNLVNWSTRSKRCVFFWNPIRNYKRNGTNNANDYANNFHSNGYPKSRLSLFVKELRRKIQGSKWKNTHCKLNHRAGLSKMWPKRITWWNLYGEIYPLCHINVYIMIYHIPTPVAPTDWIMRYFLKDHRKN
jgi:hypothetical protein